MPIVQTTTFPINAWESLGILAYLLLRMSFKTASHRYISYKHFEQVSGLIHLQVPMLVSPPHVRWPFGEGSKQSSLLPMCVHIWYKKSSPFNPPPLGYSYSPVTFPFRSQIVSSRHNPFTNPISWLVPRPVYRALQVPEAYIKLSEWYHWGPSHLTLDRGKHHSPSSQGRQTP